MQARINPVPAPLWFLMELTYTCPLQCPYCSNPVDFAQMKRELSSEEWVRVMTEARGLGASQLGFSGGEPLIREDYEFLLAQAHTLGYYTNLITSGIGLSKERLQRLKVAGLDNIQVSFQGATAKLNDQFAGMKAFARKYEVAQEIKNQGYPLGLNFVIHRHNIEQLDAFLQMALQLEADYVEIAHVQYYGFALLNRSQLLPSLEQVEQTEILVSRYQERYQNRTKFILVMPDYYQNRPKACMNGWGAVFLLVAPDGTALPCHAARMIPDLAFPNVQDHSLAWIWQDSPAFNAFRGFDWMQEPCRRCPDRFKDFGGCRCQAYLLLNNPRATDPVCALSPQHSVILSAIDAAEKESSDEAPSFIKRNPKNSKQYS